jgi:DNA-binding NarL/FixJ family response regulator
MGKIRILLADDHALVREGTRELLEQEEDLEVVAEAEDGQEAVRLANRLHPEVVLMDIAMPKLNGIEATKQIKATHPDTAVLMLTAYDDDQYIFALLEAGAAGYLLKTVGSGELVKAVRAVHAGESVLSPSIARKVVDHFARPTSELREEPADGALTEREMEVLELAAKGMTNREIAQALSLSIRTVQAHLTNVFGKLGVGSRTEAVLYALREGWLTLEDTL